jgi:hypothetical protein
MINDNFQIPKKEAVTYDPIPDNVYQVELLDIEVQDKPKYKKPDETEKMFSFQFVLLGGKDKDGSSLRGRNIWRNYVPTFLYISQKNGKNALYQITEAMIGRELTREEEATMEAVKLNKLIGGQCRVVVKNNPGKDGKVYSNIDNFLPVEFKTQSLTDDEKETARVKNIKEKSEETQTYEDTDETHNVVQNEADAITIPW